MNARPFGIPLLVASLASATLAIAADPAPPTHFDPKGKPPSQFTIDVLNQARETLPFSDTADFDENKRGLIAPMKDLQIKADAGNVAWDMEQFKFLDQQPEFDSIHPSLQRIAQLNQNYGLYEVIPGIYQIRGFDLAQLTFIRGKTGWIAYDVLVSAETARAGWKLLQEHVGEGLPITAVIYSHNHADHWGGVRGLITDEDVASGKVEVIAPVGFMDHLVAENVFAGNAMNRRLFYQYGTLLPRSAFGYVTQGLGHGVSAGSVGLVAPTRIITKPIDDTSVDGVRVIFQLTLDTEAPAEMNTYLPDQKALWMAENVIAGMHNIYTLRGAPVRDPLNWSKYLNETLWLFGQEAEVMFASHHWPRWGNERIQEVLRAQRDLYANLNNQVLHLANQGVTINQIHNVYEPPKSLQEKWYARGYHGSFEHNSRGVIQRFLGFWDANPATLIPLSPADSAPLYVEMMGGSEAILARGKTLHDEGKYLLAQEILNKLVQAEPGNQPAKDLLADVFEQIGYQQENPGLRNSFLAGAYELRNGIPQGEIAQTTSADTIRAMTTGQWLDFLGIRMDATQAEGMRYTINLITPDNGEEYVIELENATLTNIKGHQAKNPDLTLTIKRSDLEQTMMGQKTIMAQVVEGTAKARGNTAALTDIMALMVTFDPRFEIMPGTKDRSARLPQDEAFEADVGAPIAE
ncbi:alkyl/aryl-sulfatase [Thiocapsa sp.]|uniref:alkyl/aryl-sulfatase n=1 Tax=Thiocapsa sp. TaxID=2024551 RepID=UPI002C709AD4|nr:alkyl sulfatase dimerization domain-containing protein [Thiocapsa sp.]HSO81675.1 alkyl sulfatase dimerization domain-containing protein [Thiocapsa sp.]